VRNGGFAQFPAEQDGPSFYFTGKVEQADVDVFDLHANRVYLGKSIFGALFGFAALRLPTSNRDDIDVSTAVQKDAMAEFLHLAFYFFHDFFAADRRS
jgi:hypothetical protein